MDLNDNAMSVSLNSNILADNGFSLVFDAVSDPRERSAPRWPFMNQQIAQPCHDLRDVVEASMIGKKRFCNDRQIKKFDCEVSKPNKVELVKHSRFKDAKRKKTKENDDPIADIEKDFSCSMEEDNTTHYLSAFDLPDLTFVNYNMYSYEDIFVTEYDLASIIKKFEERVESKREYTCKYCGLLFKNSPALGGHISKSHSNAPAGKSQIPSNKRIKQ